jgi:acyl CoA:acetate/3-ketoacid CoA transferase alpha subunit
MAMAAKTTIAEVEEIVPVGSIEPEQVMTPAIFVHRVVQAKGLHYAG